jgi:hypothetical protein
MMMKKMLNSARKARRIVLSSLLAGCLLSMSALAQGVAAAPVQPPPAELRDGQHDFDFNIGTWTIHTRLLVHPLTGSNAWVDLNGTVHVRKVWDGRAQLEEIEADGSTGHFEGLTLFLYNPQVASVGSILCRQRSGCTESTPDRRVQERPRRTLRPGITQWADYLCSIRMVGHYSKFPPR